ncbi:MAG TPA: hypothetical protein V6C88_02770 [Chroococcidiopsis sp.]
MAGKQSKGTCVYCGKQMAKAGMTKHLVTCPQRHAAIAQAESGKGTAESIYHLRIQDAYDKTFWLDLEIRGTKTLADLDAYLRAIWLECCGHMSEFFLGGAFSHELGMRRKISQVFQPGVEITHVYDFGTSSETLAKCVDVRQGKPLTKNAIALMARNNSPEYACIECGAPATHLCIECQVEDQTAGTLCDQHTQDHPHVNYGDPLPLVNSPRLGMCGYDGPAEPPY